MTCALYNHDGTEILGSYNDESLYLFDTRHSDGADFVHKYEGHRNSATGLRFSSVGLDGFTHITHSLESYLISFKFLQ